jgi:hypothetical protein
MRGFNLFSKPLPFSKGRGLICSGGKPPFAKILVKITKLSCVLSVASGKAERALRVIFEFLHPAVAAPGRGSLRQRDAMVFLTAVLENQRLYIKS